MSCISCPFPALLLRLWFVSLSQQINYQQRRLLWTNLLGLCIIVGPLTISLSVQVTSTHSACLLCLLLCLNITICVVPKILTKIHYTITNVGFKQLVLVVESSFASLRSAAVQGLIAIFLAGLHERKAAPFAEAIVWKSNFPTFTIGKLFGHVIYWFLVPAHILRLTNCNWYPSSAPESIWVTYYACLPARSALINKELSMNKFQGWPSSSSPKSLLPCQPISWYHNPFSRACTDRDTGQRDAWHRRSKNRFRGSRTNSIKKEKP